MAENRVQPASAGASTSAQPGYGFGTAPVFLASISTILGAILFLRFGYAVANVGLWGSLMVIVLGHLVTIPTVLAVSEIATNRRVAGGGAYYIISRSFGTSIGGTIGIAEAFQPVYAWAAATYEVTPDARWVRCTLYVCFNRTDAHQGRRPGRQGIVGRQRDSGDIHSGIPSGTGSRIDPSGRASSDRPH